MDNPLTSETAAHTKTLKHRHSEGLAEGHTENPCQSRTADQLPNPGDSQWWHCPQTVCPLFKDKKDTSTTSGRAHNRNSAVVLEMRGAPAQKCNLAEIWRKKFNYFCSMNHHKLKHCEINFWCQLPAWSVWGLWQTSSAFSPVNSYRMKENCNLKMSIPRCSMNQNLQISLGKVVSISLGVKC